jgi:hypothetical protein
MPPPFSTNVALLLLAALALLAHALPEPIYTLHYVRSYRRDLVESYFGCGKSVVYGTYLYPLGPVDALYALMNSHVYGFNANCQRKDTYLKLFGAAQDYAQLIGLGGQIVSTVEAAVGRTGIKKLVIDWKYLPEEAGKREEGQKVLVELTAGLQVRGFTVFVKAPASYFCLNVGGKRYILDLPIDNLIVELYGEEPGKYITFDSIFGASSAPIGEGYTGCPKFPTLPQLSSGNKKVYLEKTLDPSLAGFIGSHL